MEEETRNELEATLRAMIKDLEDLPVGSEEHQRMSNDIKALASVLNDALSNDMDAFDRQEKRRIDEEKAKAMSQIEKDKTRFDIKKAGVEILKVIVPTAISIWAYDVFQKRMLNFEENGRITTTAGRELHLPHFFK